MSDVLNSAEIRSGTWGSLWLDGEQAAEAYGCTIKVNKTKEDVARCRTLMNGKKILIVDDVISTGESLMALEKLVEKAGGIICGRMAILAEGDAQDREDLIYLEKLPLFDSEGNPLA